MKKDTERAIFSRLVVEPIESGYLIEIETENDDIRTATNSWRLALKYLKGLEAKLKEREAEAESDPTL